MKYGKIVENTLNEVNIQSNKSGSGASIKGEFIECTVSVSAGSSEDSKSATKKKISIAVHTIEKNNSHTFTADETKMEADDIKKWEKDTQDAILKDIKMKVEQLDKTIRGFYTKYLGNIKPEQTTNKKNR